MLKPAKLSLFLLPAIIFSFFLFARASDETIVFTTYYPSPYGSYEDLYVANKMGIGTTDPGLARLTVEGGAISHDDSNIFYGNGAANSTHVNLGITSVTGTNGQDYEYCTISGGAFNNATTSGATVAGGTLNRAIGNYSTVSGGQRNNATADYATVSGGYGNEAIETYSLVFGGERNSATAESSVVAGGGDNVAKGHNATVLGGYNNSATSLYALTGGGVYNNASGEASLVGGGQSNNATSKYATVGGGLENTASGLNSTVGGGTSNLASGSMSFIGGGVDNTASEINATVMGGYNNTASGNSSFIGGGFSNVASGILATICGGHYNTASGIASTIGGGLCNIVSGGNCTVIGGNNNTAGPNAQATIGGGWNNTVSGTASVALGGWHNRVSGDYSVAIGKENNATGAYSWAGGCKANANATNSFVWGGTGSSCYANGANTFNIYASAIYFNGIIPSGHSDIAEFMDAAEQDAPQEAEIVSLVGADLLGKAKISYDPNILGVISGKKTATLHLGTAQDPKPGTVRIPVALSGRCYVKACAESGTIELGDAITSSSIPGIGMKAARSGKIIGYAMEKYEFKDPQEIKEILAFVSVGNYFSPEALDNLSKKE